MKTPVIITGLLALAIGQAPLMAQAPASAVEINELRSLVTEQQNVLEKQQAQIQSLQSALAEQKQMLLEVMHRGRDTMPVPAVEEPNTNDRVMAGQQTTENPGANANREVPKGEQEKVEQELQRGPEIADITPDTPTLRLGAAQIRLIGYPALTTLWRSTNSGGNVGTSFASLPFGNTVPGNTSEFRVSPQSTRLALRVDADLMESKAAGYFEMDFAGSPNAGNIAVTSSSYTFRIRQGWLDWSKGKFELTGGQLFSLMTPNKKDILPWPGDVAITQAIDTNYVAGLVWGRIPQLRVVYRASKQMAFGFSIENPEQQVGNSVVFPSGLSSTLDTQYNTGDTGLNVPNMTPDFVFKGSFDRELSDNRTVHFDVGTVMRVFRSWKGTLVSDMDHAFGWGVGANFNIDVVRGVRLVLDGFASDGGGRYIGGLAPDVIVSASGRILPVRSYSWVSGFEIAPNKTTGLYAYYSGLYAEKKTTLNTDGTCCVGFGYPGASSNADRMIGQATAGYSKVLWRHENIGSMQWGAQYSYVWLYPWVADIGTKSAHAHMLFTQVRFNLP